MPKISACIVAYCDYDEVCAAVRSILHYTPTPDLTLYVVDNASPDGCGKQLAETDFGDTRVTVLTLSENVGFGRGHNAVLDRLTSEVHFILNPDIVLTENILEPMAAWLLAQEGAAMATPQLHYPDGRLQHLPRRKPTPWLLLARQLAPKFDGIFKKADDHYTMQDEDLTVPAALRSAPAALWPCAPMYSKKSAGLTRVFHVCRGRRPDPESAAKGHCLADTAVFRHPCWHRAPMRDAGKFKMQLVSMGRYFKKMGLRKRDILIL